MNQIELYRPPERVVVHHVHHVTVEHRDGDDAADLRWQLKLVIISWLLCALVFAVAAGAAMAG